MEFLYSMENFKSIIHSSWCRAHPRPLSSIIYLHGDRAPGRKVSAKTWRIDVTIDLLSWGFPLTRGSNDRGRQSSPPPPPDFIVDHFDVCLPKS